MARPRKTLLHALTAASLVLAASATSAAEPNSSPAAPPAAPAAVPAPLPANDIVVARVHSIVHPVLEEFVTDELRAAAEKGAALFILELDTPGGLLTSTREIVQRILAAPIPVVVYVAPSGAQAASAGFFILQAADVAAMSPGTNTGAAHPVGGQGETIEGVLGQKAEQDAAAFIRSLASARSRNVALAEEAVVKSRSFTAEEAKRDGLIDLVAADRADLLRQLEGRTFKKPSGLSGTIRTAGLPVREVTTSPFRRFLGAVAHPNVAYILMALGFLGLYYEIITPGAVLPGVLGAICLILAFYAMSVLPVNYAGVALVFLGLLFFLAEIKITSYGLLTVAGTISIVLGGLMLFKSTDPALRVSAGVLGGVAVTALGLAGFGAWLVWRTHRRPVTTGEEGLVGQIGRARGTLGPAGRIFVRGELWNARAEDGPIEIGEAVEVVAVEAMTLRVRRATPRAPGGSR